MRCEATVVSHGMSSLTAGNRPATRWKAHNINTLKNNCRCGIVSSISSRFKEGLAILCVSYVTVRWYALQSLQVSSHSRKIGTTARRIKHRGCSVADRLVPSVQQFGGRWCNQTVASNFRVSLLFLALLDGQQAA